MEHCISCALFRPLYENAMEFANAAVVAMSPPALEALKAFSGLWFMFVLYRAMFQGRFEGAKVLIVLLLSGVVGILLSNPPLVREWLFDPALDTMAGLARSLLMLNRTRTLPEGSTVDTFVAMLRAMDDGVARVILFFNAYVASGSLMGKLTNFIESVFVLLPFYFLWALSLAYVVEGIFALMLGWTLAPFFLLAAAFEGTRGFAFSGFRIILAGVLVVLFAAVAMGFTLSVLDSVIGEHEFLREIDVGNEQNPGNISGGISSVPSTKLVMICLVSIFFHIKAAGWAANVAGAASGGSAAGIVTAAGMGATIAMRRMTGQMSGRFAGRVKDLGTKGLSAGAQKLLERYRAARGQ